MADQGSGLSSLGSTSAEGKGKGKAPDDLAQHMSLDEDEDSSDEETGAEEEVRICDLELMFSILD